MYAARALGEIGDPAAEERLIQMLSDTELGYGGQPVSEHAAESLIQIRTPTALKAAREWQKQRTK